MSRRAKKNTILAMSLVIGFTIGAFLYIGGFLPFAIGNPESGEGQTSEVVVYKSPLVWRTDGEGDELLSELASGGTYELEVRVEANQTKEVELYINIPNKKAFANKKYQAVIEVKSKKNRPEEIFVLATQLKMLFSTQAAEGEQEREYYPRPENR